MADRRMIDKHFFSSSSVRSLDYTTRLLFASMIVFADDYGRGPADVELLACNCFMRDSNISDADVRAMLGEIVSKCSVRLYSIEGVEYYELSNWDRWQDIKYKCSKHQCPEPTEAGYTDNPTAWGPGSFGDFEGDSEGAADAPPSAAPASKKPAKKTASKTPPVNYKEWVDVYNAMAGENGLSKVEVLSENRKRAIKRLTNDGHSIDDWKKACDIVANTDFLLGRCSSPGHESWRANFDFLVRPDKFVKVLEGSYGSGNSANQARKGEDEYDLDFSHPD